MIMKNYILRYGLIGGTISIAIGIINWLTIAQWYGQAVSQIFGWLTITLSLLCIPMGIKYFRDKLNNGSVSFSKSFGIGTGIAFVASTVIFIYSLLFYALAGEKFDEWTRKGLTEAEIVDLQARIDQTPDFIDVHIFQGLLLTISVFIIGLVINLISTLILKK